MNSYYIPTGQETEEHGEVQDIMRSPEVRQSPPPGRALPERRGMRLLRDFADRRPFLTFFLLVFVLSNGASSVFSILYNNWLIVQHYLDARQQQAFWNVVVPAYNLLAYSVCLGLIIYLLRPLYLCRNRLRSGQPVAAGEMAACRRLLVNLPFYVVCLNFLGWLPGTVVFPLGICLLGGWHNAGPIWLQFGLSFTVAAVVTSVQSFFLSETFLINVFYPDFFQDARPAEVPGSLRIPFGLRLLLFWSAVALAPLLVLLVVTLNFTENHPLRLPELRMLVLGVTGASLASGGMISWLVGRGLLRWMEAHIDATDQIARGNFSVRVHEQRPDEWGRLTDHFNTMATSLGRAQHGRETFGQFLSPEVRDEVLKRPPLGGEVQEITVLFVDIRGFTRRSAGESPERVVALLNRFLSLAVLAVEDNGGWVNKFLGDGIMALFGAPRPRAEHADLAVQAVRELLDRLQLLNRELAGEGQAPLEIGAGLHTGPALVGSIGATMTTVSNRQLMRREFTAIGETVNLAQRVEQLTKSCGGPLLLTEATRLRLTGSPPLTCLGPQRVPGYEEPLLIYRLETG